MKKKSFTKSCTICGKVGSDHYETNPHSLPHRNRERISICSLEIHPDLLAAYEEWELLKLREESIGYEDLQRLHKILRLKKNCGVNTVGASIIVDLLDKIENLQDELDRLRRK
jgi:MerR family transcriptional regulator, heat shock protein HspR